MDYSLEGNLKELSKSVVWLVLPSHPTEGAKCLALEEILKLQEGPSGNAALLGLLLAGVRLGCTLNPSP